MMILASLSDFFNFDLQWHFNFWTFLLYLIYITFLVMGYFLISNQVKLVKKEVWTNVDRFKCFVYAVFFAGGCEIIIAMMITFATAANYAYTAPFVVIPICYNLLLMTFYPLADFLYMASSEKELARSPPHRLLERHIINKVKKPYSYFVATLLYGLFFIVPPTLIIELGGHEFIIVWISWQMLFPMGIITFYGSKGYVTGLINDYSRIPRLGRSMVLGLEDPDRAFEEFKRDPVCRIMLPLRIYLYFWTMYSFYVTIIKLNPAQAESGFNTMQYGFTVYLVLFFGVTGYFSRFWGRRTKFKTMDIMYAAFLIAAVGINVMVNFVIVNAQLLEVPFSEWAMVDVINPVNASKFALAATIEEVVLTIVITYFFFGTVKKGFVNDSIHSFITQSEEYFDPIIPFNFLKSPDPKKREHAREVLVRIYDRAPVKKGYFLTSPELKDPLFDALCDPNLYAKKVGKELVGNLIVEYPNKMVEIIEPVLKSANFDKTRIVTDILLKKGENIVHKLNSKKIYDLISHPDYQTRRKGVLLLQMYYRLKEGNGNKLAPNDKQIETLINGLEDPDYYVEANILKLLSNFSEKVPDDIFSKRLDHQSDKIRQIAANSVGSINLASLDGAAIPKLLEMLKSPKPSVEAAVMGALTKIGNFKENNIPVDNFREGLIEHNATVRAAALKGYLKFLEENPKEIRLKSYISLLDSKKDPNIQSTLLQLVGTCWEHNIVEVYETLVEFLKSEEIEHQKIAQEYLVKMGLDSPELIVKRLLKEKDTEGILKKGRIVRALTEIGAQIPDKVFPILLLALKEKGDEKGNKIEKEQAKINSASVLSELAEQNTEKIELKPILETWLNEKSSKVKKNLSSVFSKVAKHKTKNLKRFMPLLLKGLSDKDNSVRLTISKMLVNIGKNVKNVIPLTAIKKLIEDKDAFVRENGYKLLGIEGENFPKESINFILNGLTDENDFVQTASADALISLGKNIENEEVLAEIKQLVHSKSKWTRLAALDVISMINKKKRGFVNIKEIRKFVSDDDTTFRANATDLFEGLSKDVIAENVDAILSLLEDTEEEVRKSMISSMVRISGKFKGDEIIPLLLKYLSDDTTLTLQKSIALIFRRIAKYEKQSLKDRIITMLKIRVEVSQDNLLSEVLSDLQDEKGLSIL